MTVRSCSRVTAREGKFYAVRRHNGSLSTQKQPKTAAQKAAMGNNDPMGGQPGGSAWGSAILAAKMQRQRTAALTCTLAACLLCEGGVLAMHLVKGCWVLGAPPLQQLLRVVQPVGSEGIFGVGVLRQARVCAASARPYIQHILTVAHMQVWPHPMHMVSACMAHI